MMLHTLPVLVCFFSTTNLVALEGTRNLLCESEKAMPSIGRKEDEEHIPIILDYLRSRTIYQSLWKLWHMGLLNPIETVLPASGR